MEVILTMSTHKISIHAPAKGATFITNIVSTFYNNFNPRSREGSDLGYMCKL